MASVLVELLLGLAAEVATVNQEQHAPRAGELDQTVAKDDREQRLARSRGHLHQGARTILAQRPLDTGDCLRLRRP